MYSRVSKQDTNYQQFPDPPDLPHHPRSSRSPPTPPRPSPFHAHRPHTAVAGYMSESEIRGHGCWKLVQSHRRPHSSSGGSAPTSPNLSRCYLLPTHSPHARYNTVFCIQPNLGLPYDSDSPFLALRIATQLSLQQTATSCWCEQSCLPHPLRHHT